MSAYGDREVVREREYRHGAEFVSPCGRRIWISRDTVLSVRDRHPPGTTADTGVVIVCQGAIHEIDGITYGETLRKLGLPQ